MRMAVAKIGTRGRVTLPADVREALGVHRGDALFFLVHDEQVRLARSPADCGELLALYGGPTADEMVALPPDRLGPASEAE